MLIARLSLVSGPLAVLVNFKLLKYLFLLILVWFPRSIALCLEPVPAIVLFVYTILINNNNQTVQSLPQGSPLPPVQNPTRQKAGTHASELRTENPTVLRTVAKSCSTVEPSYAVLLTVTTLPLALQL
jgi:hypothetical protein